MSDRLTTTANKRQNSDSTFNVSPFQSRGFGVQAKSEESAPASKAELWESYQQAKQLNQKGVNTSPSAIQAKLTIGVPGDKYEQEADSMAAQVMQMPEPGLANSNIANSMQTRSNQPIQRAYTDCQDETKEESKSGEDGDQIHAKEQQGQLPELTSIQRKVNSAEDPESSSNLENQLNNSKGGGSPLTDEVRGFMEPRFGADFSGVRVHTGSDAVQMNQDVNAQAFAHGQDVYFGAGKAPGKDALTAHELTHVVQQAGNHTDLQFGQTSLNKRAVQGQTNLISSSQINTIQCANDEYIPEMSVKPDNATVRMGDTHTEQLDVLNTSKAPRGTKFNWGGGVVSQKPGMEFVDLAPSERRQSRLRVKATAPGNYDIQGTLQHQVPGGTDVITTGPNIPITVPIPEVQYSHSRRDASGREDLSDETRLKVGGTKVLTMTFTNLKGPGSNLKSDLMFTGLGLNSVLNTSGLTWISPTQVEITFPAKAVGAANLNVNLFLGDMTPAQGFQTQVEAHVELDSELFGKRCELCDTLITRAYARSHTVMETLSAAYGNAWDDHEKTLAAQDASNRLAGEIILGAALAFIPGGIGGVVGGFMKKAAAGDFLVDAVKDMAKAGTRGVQSALVGREGNSAMSPMGDNPRTWRTTYFARINGEMESVLDNLINWKKNVTTPNPNFYMDFDPAELTEQSLQPLRNQPVPDLAEHSRLFELGFWKTWLETYGYTTYKQSSTKKNDDPWKNPEYYQEYNVNENQGKKIRDRITALGANGDEWLKQYGNISYQKAKKEAKQRNDEMTKADGITRLWN